MIPQHNLNLLSCGNTTQLKTISMEPRPIIPLEACRWWGYIISEQDDSKDSTTVSHRPNWALVEVTYTCVFGGRARWQNIHGNVGYKGWLLEAWLPTWGGVKLCLRITSGGRQAGITCCTNLIADGVDRITTIFLHGVWNGTRYGNGVLSNGSWVAAIAQIQSIAKKGELPGHRGTW